MIAIFLTFFARFGGIELAIGNLVLRSQQGAHSELGTHAELATIGKLCRRVLQHDGAVDRVEKPLRGRVICRNDALGVPGPVGRDVVDGLAEAVHGLVGQPVHEVHVDRGEA
mgnify:CR=1 FL=1